MKRLLNITGLAGCLAAAFFLAGGQWIALQAFAWSRMMVVYSRQGTLTEALVKTFDGRHPCKLCRAVQDAQKPRPDNTPEEKTGRVFEMLGVIHRATAPPMPTRSCARPVAADDFCCDLSIPPPTPPPKPA